MRRPGYIPFAFLIAASLLLSRATRAQQYIYQHYDPKDGLPNSSVFQVLQDKDGFIWFATNSGLSRFDGKNFKTFNTADGLPVNVIIKMFQDSRGRIWLAPFKNALCYYYQGKIYNQQNDSLLRQIHLDDFVRTVVENDKKQLLITDTRKLYYIDSQDIVKEIREQFMKPALVTHLGVRESGDFFVSFSHRLFSTNGKTFSHLQDLPEFQPMQFIAMTDRMICWLNDDTLYVRSSLYKKHYNKFVGPVNTLRLVNDSIISLNTTRGSIFYNLLQQRPEQTFLPDGNVSDCIIDQEGGYWFSTLNDGVFRLNSPVFKSIAAHTSAGQKLAVYHLEKFNDEIWAACDIGHLLKIKDNKAVPVALTVNNKTLGNTLVYSLSAKDNRLAAACGGYIFLKENGTHFKQFPAYGSTKALAWKNEKELLVASSEAFYTMALDGTKKWSIHKAGRTSCVYYRNDSAWFGTFDGLYLMKPDETVSFMGDNDSLLRAPVLSIMKSDDGTLWLATNGSGLIGLQNNRVKWHFSRHNGLNSDKVRSIAVDSGFVWAATEKELIKLDYAADSVVSRYSFADGLTSDVITTILIDKNTVYAGTPAGVTWFDKTDGFSSSMCNLKVENVSVNGNDTALKARYSLPYTNNSIRFDYVAVSMKSNGNIVYNYRVHGLDSSWKTTTQTSLELISLPPGKYRFELYAVNRFGVRSAPYSAEIDVETPFWKTNWFMISVLLLTATIAWFVGTLHNRAVIRKQIVTRKAEQQLLDLEQKALRAQMNPHFIFNCLHSIQTFILDNDAEKANKYLTRFASLIRQTLENSFHSFISLSDEIKYITTYLELEQLRSDSHFEYRIQTAPGLSTDSISVPVMVLQPFVENAVRHGMQNSNKKNGAIVIAFSKEEQELLCTIEDNGIGRQQSQVMQSQRPSVFKSRGMQLTYERIELINAGSPSKITVQIIDKINDSGHAGGTQVIIRFPIFTTKETTLA